MIASVREWTAKSRGVPCKTCVCFTVDADLRIKAPISRLRLLSSDNQLMSCGRGWVARVRETGLFPPVQLPSARFLLGEVFRTVTKTS